MEKGKMGNIGKWSFFLLCIGFAMLLGSTNVQQCNANESNDPELDNYAERAFHLGIFSSAESTIQEILQIPLPELPQTSEAPSDNVLEEESASVPQNVVSEVAGINDSGIRLIVDVWTLKVSKEVGTDDPIYHIDARNSDENKSEDIFGISRLIEIDPAQTANYVRAMNNGSFNPQKATEYDAESTVRHLELTTGEMLLTEIDLTRNWNPSPYEMSQIELDGEDMNSFDKHELAMVNFNESNDESIIYLAVESMDDLNFLLENEDLIEHEITK
jgi:hypothetical protein